MVDERRALGVAALAVGALATLRVVLFGFLDRRPHFGGSEANDLGILVRNHLPFRDPAGLDFELLFHNVLLEHHQPPLYYVGVPALLSPLATLSFGPLLATNAAALALALWTAWLFGVRLSGPRLGLLGVLVMTALPGVAGRITILGVEPWHMALMGVTMLLFLRLREPEATRWHAVALGAAIGAGLLMKLTFVAVLVGPLFLESLAALTGGPDARRWLIRLLQAGAFVVVLLLVGFLPFTTTLADFVTMAKTEPTHASVFSLAAGWTMVKWGVVLGLGRAGVVVVVLALLGAGLARLWRTPAPALGPRPSILLAASVVSLFAVHWLVPHKEPRYQLPAAWGLSMLLAIGLETWWSWGRLGRGTLAAAVGFLCYSTLVVPEDPQPPLTPDGVPDVVRLEPAELRLWADHADYGMDKLVLHESFDTNRQSYVITTLEDQSGSLLRDMIQWELHGRNRRPVIGLPQLADLRSGDASKQFRRATHLITNRKLDPEELELLEENEFVEVASSVLPLPGPKRWSLWLKGPDRRVWDTFSLDLGHWTLWSDAPEGHDHTLGRTETDEGNPGRAAMLSGSLAAGGAEGAFAMQHLLESLDRFQVSFDWRAYSTDGSPPRAQLELIDATVGSVLHRQPLTAGGAADTGWLTLPPTDFSSDLPADIPRWVYLRIGVERGSTGGGQHFLLVDNFELLRTKTGVGAVPEGGPTEPSTPR
ncbi:MAG: hypothetical protein GY898_19480 [Proteobacteria bacterium]|nr:hypothetical protein [Pseudomonadota bacterium]